MDLYKNLYRHAEGAADGAGGEAGVNAAPTAENGQDNQPQETWADVKKKWSKEYGADVQSAVQKRFAGVNQLKADLGRANGIVARVAERYKIQADENGNYDIAAVEKAFDDDDAQYEELADELGVSVEFAKERAQQQRQIEAYKRKEKQQALEADRFARFQAHQQQAAELKKTFPDFDLLAEMDDRTFATMLNNGFSVEEAFYTVHRKELMQASSQAAAKQAAESLSAAIQAGRARPTEGGLSKGAATRTDRATNPTYDKAKRAEIRKRAARGEKVYL